MGYMNKRPSIPVIDNRHDDKPSLEGQHHDIEEITIKDNYYYVGVGDIGEERRLGRDAWTVWAGKRKVSGGNGGGGPHQRLSRRTELVGVPLVSAYYRCS